MPTSSKPTHRANEQRPLIGSHQTDLDVPSNADRDSTVPSLEHLWDYKLVVSGESDSTEDLDSIAHLFADNDQDSEDTDHLSLASQVTAFESEGSQSIDPRAVVGAGGQFDTGYPPRYGPDDPDPTTNSRPWLSLPSTRSNTGATEKEPNPISVVGSSDAAQSEKIASANQANAGPPESSSIENTLAGIVVCLVVAIILSTGMAMYQEN